MRLRALRIMRIPLFMSLNFSPASKSPFSLPYSFSIILNNQSPIVRLTLKHNPLNKNNKHLLQKNKTCTSR